MISTHVLDLTSGFPAKNLKVKLEHHRSPEWTLIEETTTNADGRISFQGEALPGDYRLTFFIEDYLASEGRSYFFTVAPVTFRITDAGRKHHVPLLLNSFGYSTYRGS